MQFTALSSLFVLTALAVHGVTATALAVRQGETECPVICVDLIVSDLFYPAFTCSDGSQCVIGDTEEPDVFTPLGVIGVARGVSISCI